jgi:hypothetical protein
LGQRSAGLGFGTSFRNQNENSPVAITFIKLRASGFSQVFRALTGLDLTER